MVAQWITGLPLFTQTTNLITLSHLPPMEAYLDYLSVHFAIGLHFLTSYHATGPARHNPNTLPDLSGLHHLYNLSKHLLMGKLEDRTIHLPVQRVQAITSPNPDKTTTPRQLHNQWIRTLPTPVTIIYSDGSKLDDGSTGYGWAIYQPGNKHLQVSEGYCYLRKRVAVFDTELQAIQEATSWLLTTTLPRTDVYICMDNKATIDTLRLKKYNHEYARWTLTNIAQVHSLRAKVHTVWCPSHSNIPGNERANILTKNGVSSYTPCQYATTTKTWLQAQARLQLLQ